MIFFSDSRFIERLCRYDVSAILRLQRLNVVSIGNTDGLLSSQQKFFIPLIYLSIGVQEQKVCWYYGWYSLNYVYIFESIKKCCELIISLSLLLIAFWTTFQLLLSAFDLLKISWFIRQAVRMIKATRSFKQSVVYLIIICFEMQDNLRLLMHEEMS